MCTVMNLDSAGLPNQLSFLVNWAFLINEYTGMAMTKPRDRPVAFQGIASYISRLSRSTNACGGSGTGVSFIDGLPVPCFLPSLLWRVCSTEGRRPSQSIAAKSTKTCVVAECYVNTLSWVSVEGQVHIPYKWPACSTPRPVTTIFAPGFNSGTFALQKRTQLIELLPDPKACEAAQNTSDYELPGIPERREFWTIFTGYRYCTRVVSLIHTTNLLSRAILEGPTFNYTTPGTCGSRTLSPGGCMVHWDHPEWGHGLTDSFTLMNLDLGCLRVSHFGLVMQVTCLTVIEWEWSEHGGYLRDMAGKNLDSWQPNSAAGIVLVKNKGEEVYTRIGYWELVKWNPHHPPYGPIREEAKVRRVTVV